jgi:hypothetical protein
MPALLNIQAWKARNDNARAVDRRVLNEQLLHMEANQQLLKEKLSEFSSRPTGDLTNSRAQMRSRVLL